MQSARNTSRIVQVEFGTSEEEVLKFNPWLHHFPNKNETWKENMMKEQQVTKADYKLIGKIVRILHEYYNTSSTRELHEIIFLEFREKKTKPNIRSDKPWSQVWQITRFWLYFERPTAIAGGIHHCGGALATAAPLLPSFLWVYPAGLELEGYSGLLRLRPS